MSGFEESHKEDVNGKLVSRFDLKGQSPESLTVLMGFSGTGKTSLCIPIYNYITSPNELGIRGQCTSGTAYLKKMYEDFIDLEHFPVKTGIEEAHHLRFELTKDEGSERRVRIPGTEAKANSITLDILDVAGDAYQFFLDNQPDSSDQFQGLKGDPREFADFKRGLLTYATSKAGKLSQFAGLLSTERLIIAISCLEYKDWPTRDFAYSEFLRLLYGARGRPFREPPIMLFTMADMLDPAVGGKRAEELLDVLPNTKNFLEDTLRYRKLPALKTYIQIKRDKRNRPVDKDGAPISVGGPISADGKKKPPPFVPDIEVMSDGTKRPKYDNVALSNLFNWLFNAHSRGWP